MPSRGQFVVRDTAWWEARTTPEPNTGCLIWLGTVCKLGYGRVSPARDGEQLIHRIAYRQFVGLLPKSLKVCHTCDHPWCVNPDHLFLGTQKDNLRDMYQKGRSRPFGAPFDGTNWRIPKDGAA